MKRYFSAAVLALSVAVGAPACTAAYYQRGPAAAPSRDRAFDRGYRDGVDEGRSDARHRLRFQPEEAARFRSADHGYDRGYGPPTEWARVYRDGFRQGYERGFRDYR
ncbi:MAG TPA: hypothetical protein VHZ73_03165 [Vicinamibacterales bacterium]|jgi:hypothetical protein|nr:hypothetical protein [Vicinamibacterales bacterium]